MESPDAYQPPAWLPGGHAQTIYAATLCPRPRVGYRRERWDTPDGDFIDLDRLPGEPGAAQVVLFHGLEGCSRSHYALALMHALQGSGRRGTVVHFRGCSGELNRQPRAYHSGDSAEIDWILRRMKAADPSAPLFAVGVSLGGNVLLKWLGERAHGAGRVLDAAVAVSAPMDLVAAGWNLARGFNRVYTARFLASLKAKSLTQLELHPGLFDAAAVRAARTLHQFDNAVTAPLHGFRDADDYWERASSKPLLGRIRVPTLVLNARNDPFLPASALPRPDQVSPAVTLELPEQGGHVGFVGGRFPGCLCWLPARILGFFDSQAADGTERHVSGQ